MTFLFIFLGVIDVYAQMALIFKMFKFPYFEYFKEITIFSIFISLISYIMRVSLDLPEISDIIFHFILIVIFLRFIIKILFWRAIITSLPYFGYGLLSFLFYSTYTLLGINSSLLIQCSQIILGIGISLLLNKLNLGFSWYSRPPHDFYIQTAMSRSDFQLIIAVLSVSVLFFTGFQIVWNHQMMEVIPFILTGFLLLVYLGYKRDTQR